MKLALTVLKLSLGGLGVLLFFYRNDQFSKFAREGSRTADALHTVLVNNHGSFSYITSAQSDHLRALVIGSVSLFGLNRAGSRPAAPLQVGIALSSRCRSRTNPPSKSRASLRPVGLAGHRSFYRKSGLLMILMSGRATLDAQRGEGHAPARPATG